MAARRSASGMLLLCSLALAGCGGGSVALRGGFPAAQSVPATPGAQPGLTASGHGGLGLAILLGLIVADGVHWLGNRLRHDGGEPSAQDEARPLWRPLDRGWVDR
ncbi:MAG: hypothetical protein IT531_16070 [Burkholderiales bacterium]|nr:hypothetical protein [Burkholderiales bacterium]